MHLGECTARCTSVGKALRLRACEAGIVGCMWESVGEAGRVMEQRLKQKGRAGLRVIGDGAHAEEGCEAVASRGCLRATNGESNVRP